MVESLIQKPWGSERIIAKTDKYVVKELHINPGCRLSLQYHEKKIEHMTLISGSGYLFIQYEGFIKKTSMKKMVPYFIDAKSIHRLEGSRTGGSCLIIEVSTIELDDICRIEDDYKRK